MSAELGQAGRTEARRPADKRRFRGSAGAVFVPHPLIDEVTIQSYLAAGEWSLVEEKPAKKAASSPKS